VAIMPELNATLVKQIAQDEPEKLKPNEVSYIEQFAFRRSHQHGFMFAEN
jgi:hypothetical protein